MKKRFGFYCAVWAILLALFNVIAFVLPGLECRAQFAAFWIGYGLITLMFIGQLLCAYFALKEENSKKLFYKLPLIGISYAGLIASFIVGGLVMAIYVLPYWIGVVACAIVLAATAISVVKASAAADEAEKVDEKIKVQTFFIKALTVDAESLLDRAKTEEIKAECKKVYDAVRYSDPMSGEMLASIESQIITAFAKLSEAVASADAEAVKAAAEEVNVLIADRNRKCKLLK